MKIGLIHTIKTTFQIMTEVCKEIIPVVKLNHFLDEEILKNEPSGINATFSLNCALGCDHSHVSVMISPALGTLPHAPNVRT